VHSTSSRQETGIRLDGASRTGAGGQPARVEEREFVHPVVRAQAPSTAHPSRESWPVGIAAGKSLQQRSLTIDAARAQGKGRSIVVVPSRTVDRWDEPPAEAEAYEQRMLSALFELRDTNLRMTYVTSSPIAPAIVSYYLSLLPRGLRAGARRRLSLIAVGDRSARPLAEKLLERPHVLERIRSGVREPQLSHLFTYNTGRGERDLALALDLPIYGPEPRHADLGTKSGCRELFALAQIPHPLGAERIKTRSDVARAAAHLRALRPDLVQLVIKLNDGMSGEGNALLDLGGLPLPGAPDELSRIVERIPALVPAAPSVTASAFLEKLASQGASSRSGSSGKRFAVRASSSTSPRAVRSSCSRPTIRSSVAPAASSIWGAAFRPTPPMRR
jgi:hypothetical protein